MTQEQQLAELLHEQYCQDNHTDGCDWFYRTWENPIWARQRYLDWAGRLLSDGRLTFDTIMNTIRLLAETRNPAKASGT